MYHEEGSAGAFQLKRVLQLVPPLLRWAQVTCRVALGRVLLWRTAQVLPGWSCASLFQWEESCSASEGEEAEVPVKV